MSGPVLSVRGLHVRFPSEAGPVHAVRGLELDLYPGRTLGIVGESGSGKSVTSLAVMGLLPEYAAVTGSVRLDGRELLGLDDRQMSRVRGRDIAMVFQDPLSSLTPIFSVGRQIVEALQVHQDLEDRRARSRAVELLDLVGIPNPRTRLDSFPHEFSGGMRQRVMIAMAIANDPKVLIADEPTTALDVTVQAQILDVLALAQAETGAALVLITHDLGVIAGTADDVLVMYAGRAVEAAPVDTLFAAPRMPYTIGLLDAVPRVDDAERRPLVPIPGTPPVPVGLPPGCPFAPRCPIAVDACRAGEPDLTEVDDASRARTSPPAPARPPGRAGPPRPVGHRVACLRAGQIVDGAVDGRPVYPTPELTGDRLVDIPRETRRTVLSLTGLERTFPLLKGFILKRRVGSVHAVAGVSLDIREGETLGLVGESGCGKTTTLLEVMRMRPPERGRIEIAGTDVTTLRGRRAERALRREVQMVFQDPMGALDPRLTVFDILAEPLHAAGVADRAAVATRVGELMELVGLDPEHVERFPAAFSGGQRQRIGIARSLATNPSLLVLDEPVSALDVSIQAGVLNLLADLKARLGLSYLFVAHDLAVIRHVCDRVAVMYVGRIVEIGSADAVYGRPRHPYTEALLSAIPIPDPKVERARERVLLTGEIPSAVDPGPGCRFAGRCPLQQSLDADRARRCLEQTPALRRVGDADHQHACHHR